MGNDHRKVQDSYLHYSVPLALAFKGPEHNFEVKKLPQCGSGKTLEKNDHSSRQGAFFNWKILGLVVQSIISLKSSLVVCSNKYNILIKGIFAEKNVSTQQKY